MSFIEKIENRIISTGSMLCVGLDPYSSTMDSLGFHDIFEFNRLLIDSLSPYTCAFKPQVAHYSALGKEQDLVETIRYLNEYYPFIPVILDAKRSDIGNTARFYAKEAFERYKADAVTVNPYMGLDTIEPFLRYDDKAVVVLAKTSNPGARDFQDIEDTNGTKIYMHVVQKFSEKIGPDKLLFVLGATYPEDIKKVRMLCPEHYFLVPGFGKQGGTVEQVFAVGINSNGRGLILNMSRSITAPNEKLYNSLEQYVSLIKLRAESFVDSFGRAFSSNRR